MQVFMLHANKAMLTRLSNSLTHIVDLNNVLLC